MKYFDIAQTYYDKDNQIIVLTFNNSFDFENVLIRIIQSQMWEHYKKRSEKLPSTQDFVKWFGINNVTGAPHWGAMYYGMFFEHSVIMDYLKAYHDQINNFELSIVRTLEKQKLLEYRGDKIVKPKNSPVFHIVAVNAALCDADDFNVNAIVAHELGHYIFHRYKAYATKSRQAFKKLSAKSKKKISEELKAAFYPGVMDQIAEEFTANLAEKNKYMMEIVDTFSKKDQRIIKEIEKSYEEKIIELVANEN